jgi:hypothetical protein
MFRVIGLLKMVRARYRHGFLPSCRGVIVPKEQYVNE